LPLQIAELSLRVSDSHAVHLIRWIDLLLAEAGWSKTDLDGYVATRGPGSFTGIRAGLGTVRGLSLATGRPSVGVSTLEALVEAHGPAEAERVALMAAGRGEVYAARYDAASSPPVELRGPWLGLPSSAAPAEAGRAVLVLAASSDPAILQSSTGHAGTRLARAPANIAGAAGRLALLRGLAAAEAASSLAPLYVRPPDAELKSTRR
jgi:tRNA threonylcarbamoyladenosine biosynthesis protein TsaB